MRCHNCSQESIKVENGHIKCDICGLDIIITNLDEEIYDLFIYNLDLFQAEQEGRDDYDHGGVNRYNDALLALMWEKGNKVERISNERTAFSLSVKKLQKEIDAKEAEITKLLVEEGKYLDFMNLVVRFFLGIKKKSYFFGYKYKRDIDKKYQEIEQSRLFEFPDK